jgi:hypothetical protein
MTIFALNATNLTAGQSVMLETSSLPGGVLALMASSIASNAPKYLAMTDVLTDAGLPLATVTASGTTPGIARTAGTSQYLTGVATSGAQTVTTKMLWNFNISASYVAGATIPVVVQCVVPTATDVTASTTTMTVAAYSVSPAGVETSLTVSAAQQIPITTAAALTFSVTGTGLVGGQRMALELTMAVTTIAGGASNGEVLSVSYLA